MKNVLLLTDFSDNSLNAMRYAIAMLFDEKCVFYLAHIHKVGTMTTDDLMVSGTQSIYQSIAQEPKDRLLKIKDTLLPKSNKELHKFEVRVDFDVFLSAVNQLINFNKIDLIVMGTNGATGAKEVLFGSNTLQIIRSVKIPVFVVPENASYDEARNVLIPLQYNECPKTALVSNILSVLPLEHASLHLLHVDPEVTKFDFNEKSYEKLVKLAEKISVLKNIPFQWAIKSYVQLFNIDIMTFFLHKESLIERVIGDNTTSKIANSSLIPILFLK